MLLEKKLQVEIVLTNQIAKLKEHLVQEVQQVRIIVKVHKAKHRAVNPLLLVLKLMLNLSHRR